MRRIATIALLIVAALATHGARHRAWGEEAAAKPEGATCDHAAFRYPTGVALAGCSFAAVASRSSGGNPGRTDRETAG